MVANSFNYSKATTLRTKSFDILQQNHSLFDILRQNRSIILCFMEDRRVKIKRVKMQSEDCSSFDNIKFIYIYIKVSIIKRS